MYFVANDRVIDIAIAFLNSFRKFNPEIPLCLIPFTKDNNKLKQLQNQYRFSVYENQEMLTYCDELSRQFHQETIGHYRKLVIWDGPFDEFIYIDIDILILKSLDFVFRLLEHYDFIVSCSNIPSTEKWVWKKSIYQTGKLTQEQIQYAANTGFMVSKKHAIKKDDINMRINAALELKQHMELFCMDQSFINYLIVTCGKRYTSFLLLLDSPLYPENYVEFWAGEDKKKLREDLNTGLQTLLEGKWREVLLIHWAGVWQLKKSEIKLSNLLKSMKLRRYDWPVSIFMPLKKLWKHYRTMHLDMKA